ncbi:MAG: hypothetical protein NTV51_17605 [Verrucomicrobia bacterium]|nr:hypothetical protein [Verrucomicrobiota bacterium]
MNPTPRARPALRHFPCACFARLRRGATVLMGLAALMVGAVAGAAETEQPVDTFITRRGDKFFEGEAEFRFVSANLPDVLQIITHYRFDSDQRDARYRLPDDFELRDSVRTVRQLGGRVMRTFVLTCRAEPAPAFMFAVGGERVVPNEAALRVLDRLLQLCHEEGVRLIVPLVAYNSGIRGDVTTYGQDFWTVGSGANRRFKDMLALFLNRTNAFTGVRYRDDPAILAWQTGNELVIGETADRRAWLHDTAAYVKKLDTKHLLIDGRNRPADVFGQYDEFAADPNLDAVSYHTYVHLPQANTAAGTLRLMREMTQGKIPLLVTEIAMTTPPAALRALLDEVVGGGTVGAAWWGVRVHNRDGGFYKHSDRGSQFEDLNWPGFADPAGYLPEIAREQELCTILADYAARIRGLPPAPVGPPAPPVLLPASDVGHLSWRGATGAQSYELQRAERPDGLWSVLEPRLQDHLVVCAPLYCDASAEEGRSYLYRIIARNAAGASAPSAAVGPLKVGPRWLVDELFDLRLAAAAANLRVDKSYAHSAYLEDVAVVRRDDPARAASLVYRVSGALRSFSVGVFEPGVPPRFFLRRGGGAKTEIVPQVARYGGGRRARFTGTISDGADTLEIELGAEAPATQAIGRVELSFTSK